MGNLNYRSPFFLHGNLSRPLRLIMTSQSFLKKYSLAVFHKCTLTSSKDWLIWLHSHSWKNILYPFSTIINFSRSEDWLIWQEFGDLWLTCLKFNPMSAPPAAKGSKPIYTWMFLINLLILSDLKTENDDEMIAKAKGSTPIYKWIFSLNLLIPSEL